jgi:hypothetical protein
VSRKRIPITTSGTVYDQSSRYLLRLDELPMLHWLLGLTGEEIEFVDWAETKNLPWPGQSERTCDTVAWLRDRTCGGLPWLVVIEFQSEPDAEMFGRLLEYLGAAWRRLKPTKLPGDRFSVGAVVVNLTGTGDASRRMRLPRGRVRTDLIVQEWNMGALSADNLIKQVKSGKAPRMALPFAPLMKKGDDPAMMRRWLALAEQESNPERKSALGLVRVFAEKAGCVEVWRQALEGWNVTESQVVREWTAKAREETAAKTRAEDLVLFLQERFGELPESLNKILVATQDQEQLNRWIRLAAKARDLPHFQEQAGV